MRYAICLALSWWTAASLAAPPQHFERARVVASEPIYSRVEVRTPERYCHTRDWRHREVRESRAMGAIIGGVVGGAVGGSMGRHRHHHHHRDRHLGAALGAVAGAAIGAEISGGRGHERCETVERVEYREEITGYHVTYEYRGRLYHTESTTPPGRYLELAVYAEPLVD